MDEEGRKYLDGLLNAIETTEQDLSKLVGIIAGEAEQEMTKNRRS
jgi:hypothetical protein